jgi:hypothetical protein
MSRSRAIGLMGCCAVAIGVASRAEADFVSYLLTKTAVTVPATQTASGIATAVDVYTIYARFDGPTDTVVYAYNLAYLGGASAADAYAQFYHSDNTPLNEGVLQRAHGTWAASQTGNLANRARDSYLCVGGVPSGVNSTASDPAWTLGGSGAHVGHADGWSRPDLVNNGTVGWFNSLPPNLQGRVGGAGNTPTDVRLGQFVIDAGSSLGTWSLTIAYTDGTSGAASRFATSVLPIPGDGQCPTLYRDVDGDGFGALGSGALSSCAPLVGYVANNLDCDDSRAAVHPGTTWYLDLDGDGFGSASSGTVTQCVQPTGYALAGGDCDDASPVLNPQTSWFRDLDGDGFGSAANGVVSQCVQPAGYALEGSDCDDGNAAVNPNTVWYRDVDGDGFGATASGTLTQCDAPTAAGFVLVGGDCDDSEATVSPQSLWTRDGDGDGFGAASSGSLVQVKDMRNALATAAETGFQAPITALLEQLYACGIEHGMADLDHAGLFVELARRNGVPFNPA